MGRKRKIIEINAKYSFRKGYDSLKRIEQPLVRKEIMQAFNLKTAVTFYDRMKGKVIPRMDEKEVIESIFKKYGITKIWGAE